MTNHKTKYLKLVKHCTITLSIVVTTSLFTTAVSAQSNIRDLYPQLADLFNAFDVTQANAFEKIADINANPSTQAARDELQMNLNMSTSMSMSEMMAAGGGMDMGMNGPYQELEVQARMELLENMRGKYSDEEAEAAYDNSAPVNRHTAEVLKRGRSFETNLFNIYIDDSINDKQAAVAAAVEDYLSDDRHSVASIPKESTYLIEHLQANGFKTAFPLLSGFLWSQQWLQLAALQAVILENVDPQFSGGVDVALERFWNKVGSSGGMTMFPAPSELPMAPAIAPDLYSQSEDAAIIIDNLNVLETVITDILSYPNVENRDGLVDATIARFTNKTEDNIEYMDYLLFALRGGIYNQGGPAVGELMQSERNRSRAAMDMKHSMIMSTQ
ncbi:MAG: hypothetical protein COA96_11775 [SAR86 cluster bacterium]|uniref:Uncharacterized protein n=1 Tax=SAR86 cluster bacterium TaxID=2030880 RepID=A0A2A5AVV2_9GAMM|nr:MAG: hypothetical protein COA96_11775 [SAR86 cluster bacterium]